MRDAKSTTTFIQALNESLESGALMCQLYSAELNKYVMKLTNEFCREQASLGIPFNQYVKKAAECLGRQPRSNIWVLNEDVQLTEDGELIPSTETEYIWLGGMVGNRALSNVAPADDAAIVPLMTTAQKALDATLSCLKTAVRNNFVAAFFLISSAGMALHYETVMEKYVMCPTPIGVGLKNAGKSTAAKTAIALLGTPQFFVRDFSTSQTSVLSSRKTFPTVLDDPSDLSKVKDLIDNTFNAGARTRSRCTNVSRTTALITMNWDRMKSLCSNYK